MGEQTKEMDFDELQQLLKTGEPAVGYLLLNGTHLVGEIHLNPEKLNAALTELFGSKEIKLFDSEEDEQMALEKLRKLPADTYEAAVVQSQRGYYSPITLQEDAEILSEFFLSASNEVIRTRLIRKMVKWTVLVMMEDFEGQFANAVLEVQSIAQMRAEREIRKELGMKLLTVDEMEAVVLGPGKKSMRKMWDVRRGGLRNRGVFQWTPDHQIKFYETVENLPLIGRESAWRYAKKQILSGRLDDAQQRFLMSLPEFEHVQDLLKQAIHTWSYDSDKNMPPRYFAFQHALILLNYSTSTNFHTLKDHYYKGRRLVGARNSPQN